MQGRRNQGGKGGSSPPAQKSRGAEPPCYCYSQLVKIVRYMHHSTVLLASKFTDECVCHLVPQIAPKLFYKAAKIRSFLGEDAPRPPYIKID